MIRVTFLIVVCSLALCACGGGGGGSGSSSTVSGPGLGVAGQLPQVSGAPAIAGNPATSVRQDEAYVFQPTATPAGPTALIFSIANCPPWATFDTATGRLSGTPTATDIGTNTDIRIQASDGVNTLSLPAFDITVVPASHGSVTVSWVPPTENTDNSPLADLAGFDVYWGTKPGELTNKVEIGTPGATTYIFDSLPPATYYFAVTAVNSDGDQSQLSPPASITVY